MTDKTAVLYCRVSTNKQAEEELPLQSQQQRCEDKARALDAAILRVYTDEGLSARSDSRPAFQQAILYCETHSPTYFITWSTSRFARNRLDAQLYKRRLSKAGTTLLYAGLDIDRDSDGGWLTEGVLELFDEFASKQIAADTRRSMIKAAQSGYWCGGRFPFGYHGIPAPDNPRRTCLEPNPAETAIVHRMFALRAQGYGSKTIAATLNSEGIYNRRYRWNITTVLALLRNPAVIGQIAFGRVVRVDGERRAVPRSDWIVVNAHAPIIDRALWETVQRLIDQDAPIPHREAGLPTGSPHSAFVFTGLLRCACCGASLQIEHAKGRSQRYSYYNCRNAQRKGDCPPRRLPAPQLDDWLINIICGEVFTPDNLRTVAHDLREMASRWRDEQAARRRAVEHQIKEVGRRNSKLYEIMEEFGRDTPNLGDLTHRLRENNARLRQLQDDLQKIDAEEPPRIEITDNDLEMLSKLLVGLIKSEYNAAKARAFFSSFIKEIRVEKQSIGIEYDPRSLLAGAAVHSTVKWRPDPESQGTIIRNLTRQIPASVMPLKVRRRG